MRRCDAAEAGFVRALRHVDVPVDGLQMGQAPEPQQGWPGGVAMFAPHAEQGHAMVDLSRPPQSAAALRAPPALEPLEQADVVARGGPQIPGDDARRMPDGIPVRSPLPQITMPSESVDWLPAYAAKPWAAPVGGLAIGCRWNAKARRYS